MDCLIFDNEQYIFLHILFEEELTRLLFPVIFNKRTKILSNEEQGIFFSQEVERIFKDNDNFMDYFCVGPKEFALLNISNPEKSKVNKIYHHNLYYYLNRFLRIILRFRGSYGSSKTALLSVIFIIKMEKYIF